MLDAGTGLLKRYNGGEGFAHREYDHWFDQFKDAVVRCFGSRSLAAAYFQASRKTSFVFILPDGSRLTMPQLIASARPIVDGEVKEHQKATKQERGELIEPVEGEADEKFVAIDQLRSEVATLGKWVRSLERQAPKKRP